MTRVLANPEGPAKKVQEILTPCLADMGFDLVNVRLDSLGGKRKTLLITAEKPDNGGINLDECAEISRASAALLDVEDVISDSYYLEVSSPGIDRELVRQEDFDYAMGFEVKIKLKMPIGERVNFRGILKSRTEVGVVMELDDESVELAFDKMQKAKLILSDELLEAKKR